MPVRFHPAAERELLQEVDYYTSGRQGAGVKFAAAVEQAVARLAARPLSGAPSFGNTRGMRVKGFPFNVVYAVVGDAIVVLAVAPHRRRPQYWASRLE